MKKWYTFLSLLLFTLSASYGQNIAPHFTELRGMEDFNGNTNLFYRIYSYQKDHSNLMFNNIYLLNTYTLADSLYLEENWNTTGPEIYDYDFWDNDPHKYIACGNYFTNSTMGGSSPLIFIFDYRHMSFPYSSNMFDNSSINFVGVSRQNDSLVYCTWAGYLFKSTSGGSTWDTISQFNAVSLSPYNDKVLFAYDYVYVNNGLSKTSDGGLTKTPVDTTPYDYEWNPHKNIFYDKDTNYIYRVAHYTQGSTVYNFLVSDNSGNANSWHVRYTSSLPTYISVDYSKAGSVYLATGTNIYYSTDFGNTFNSLKSFEKNLVGIYKKPGSSKLYTSTDSTIYEIDGSTVNIIKYPFDKENFKYDPLDVGNKWVYSNKLSVGNSGKYFVNSKEILKDTILANQHNYKQIKSVTFDSSSTNISFSYERIDSLTGKVYAWNIGTSVEYQIDDISMNLGDTINVSRFGSSGSKASFDNLGYKDIFGNFNFAKTRVYNSPISYLGYGDIYWLTYNIGLTYHLSTRDLTSTVSNLKGAIIKGVVYGDTSFTIVGVNDKDPVQPKEFNLSQNYPNPFNPSTIINYSLPKAGNVKLIVYNALGSKVATILNEYKQPGNYSVQFNSSNNASGIYFYKLEAGQFSQIKKMIVLK
jgi:Secretion system C-terminal sorting domain